MSDTRTDAARPPVFEPDAFAPASADAASYSRVVRLLKIALPLSALAILLTMVLFSVLHKPDGSVAVTYSTKELEEGKIIMNEPRFVGADPDGQTFEVTASRAFQDTVFTERISLEEIVADVTLESGLGLHIAAALGEIDTKNELLALTGPIVLESSDGYRIATDEVKVDLAQGQLTGRKPIEAKGPFGTITADGFEVNRGDKRLRFIGNVRMKINPREVSRP